MENNNEVVLDATLVKIDLTPSNPNDFNRIFSGDNKTLVRDCIYGSYRHKNYLEYLQMAWSNHYGIII
jgi:hypothetical protein